MISVGPTSVVEDAVFFHVIPNSNVWTPDVPISKTQTDGLYVAGIMTPEARGYPRDAWGHIKVPRIEYYEGTSTPEDKGWYKTANFTLDLNSYSSFIGITIGGIDSADFFDHFTTVQVMYFNLMCDQYRGQSRFLSNQNVDRTCILEQLHHSNRRTTPSRSQSLYLRR
ncbi:unnamed protein product [Alternaria alternata]|jgi:hypothetical protein